MRRTSILLRLVGLVALVTVVLVAPAHGANSQVFQDAAGDNEGAGTAFYAVDITSVSVESSDNGDMVFTVVVRTADGDGGNLYNGDHVDLYIDDDNNQSTGDDGNETAFRASGRTVPGQAGQVPLVEFCEEGQLGLTCEPLPAEFFSSVVTPPNTHVLSFYLSTFNYFTIGLKVVTEYTTNHDFAPESGYFEYDVRADADGDGISGSADKCPTKPGGRFDGNRDGCPGPYQTLPKIGIKYGSWTKTSSSVRYSSFGVTGVPGQAKVKVRAGGATFSRKGSGSISGLANRNLRAGMTITFTASRAGWCSAVRTIKIKPGASNGYTTLSERVISPSGIECT